ncbi:MAG: replication restart DNA helicase PriA [Synechococcales bacterium]|nr:replication restart DNA helicase PriA [Synechococcales bacterium]
MTVVQEMIQSVRCPNCGSPAERIYTFTHQLTRTQCHHCDYLMVTCSQSGRVVEAYAPGIPVF